MGSAGQWLFLGSTSAARAENAGRAFGPRGASGKRTGCTTWERTPSTVCWRRCGVGLFRDSDFAGFYCLDNGRDSLLATALILQTQGKVSDAKVTVQTSWDLSGVPSVGIGNLAMKDRSR